MNKLNVSQVEAYLLNGASHTFRTVCDAFSATPQQEGQIDKIIQRLRKAGKITKSRNGQHILWTAVPPVALAS